VLDDCNTEIKPTLIRYAKCWEDADVLLEALNIRPGEVCLSIASAGDNTLSLLTRDPAKVIAVDLSPAQLACLHLRVAAYRVLDHGELLELIGERDSDRRWELYLRCRDALPEEARRFWDVQPHAILAGIGTAGRFERYLSMFRRYVLPLIHRASLVEALFETRSEAERIRFYDEQWDTVRWRLLISIFFSRRVASLLGRDRRFFRYVDGATGKRALARARHALVELDPSRNPYLAWIVTGRHGSVMPHALRPENFAPIRSRVDRLEYRTMALDRCLEEAGERSIDRFNLSDVFEYMSEDDAARHYSAISRAGRPGGRLAYWNAYVRRRRPESLADRLRSASSLADALHRVDKAFIYESFVIEEIA